MDRVGHLGWIQIDCANPMRLAAFWSEVLGVEIDQPPDGDPPHYVNLIPGTPNEPIVCFQRVPEAKNVKNRLHLDIEVGDIGSATLRVQDLGGRRLDSDDFTEYGFRWRVMADPAGNEFCLVTRLTHS